MRPDHLNPLKNSVKKTEPKDKAAGKQFTKALDKRDPKDDKLREKKDDVKEERKVEKTEPGRKSAGEVADKRSESDSRSPQKV